MDGYLNLGGVRLPRLSATSSQVGIPKSADPPARYSFQVESTTFHHFPLPFRHLWNRYSWQSDCRPGEVRFRPVFMQVSMGQQTKKAPGFRALPVCDIYRSFQK